MRTLPGYRVGRAADAVHAAPVGIAAAADLAVAAVLGRAGSEEAAGDSWDRLRGSVRVPETETG